MKKFFKRKDQAERSQDEPDMLTLLQEIKTQLVFLEKKVDALSSQPQERRNDRPYSHGKGDRAGGFRDRGFKAVCAECGQSCEVPFKPSGGRPVYCKECFSKREGGSFAGRRDGRPRSSGFREERHSGQDFGSRPDSERSFGKRPPFHGKKRF